MHFMATVSHVAPSTQSASLAQLSAQACPPHTNGAQAFVSAAVASGQLPKPSQ
jgi:hypothetical protein